MSVRIGATPSVQTPSGVIGYCYDTGAQTNVATTSSTIADISSRLSVSFTVPASGAVLVTLSGWISTNGASSIYNWGLRDGSTTIADVFATYPGGLTRVDQERATVQIVVTNLTPGAPATWKWAHRLSAGSGSSSIDFGQGLSSMIVEALGGTAAATRSAPKSIDDLGDFNEIYGSAYTGHDQEFNAVNSSTLPAGWTWQNQGTSTYRERFGGGTLIHQGDTAWRSIVQSLTGAPSTWDVYAKVGVSTNRSGNHEWGILLTDGTVHRIFERYVASNYTDQARIAYWSTATSFTSVSGSQDTWMGMKDAYLRVRKNSSTSYDYWTSADGLTWISVLTAHNPGLTPTHIGLTVYPPSGIPMELVCHWFRMR